MRKHPTLILILFLFSLTVRSQNFKNSITMLEGIWIQSDFKKSFDSTRSINGSRNAFDYSLPVALRINTTEIYNGKLNIGYSTLHTHFKHLEISRFIVQNKDTIFEAGNFSVDLNKYNDSLPFNIGYIPYFNSEGKDTHFSYKIANLDTILFLVNENSDTINYTRFKTKFDSENSFPNPLYNYTLNKALVGNYKLYLPGKKLICENLTIKDNGEIRGYKEFLDKRIYYSTDVYCGKPINLDVVEICQFPIIDYLNQICKSYIIVRKGNGDLVFYEYDWNDDLAIKFDPKKRVKYILEKM